MQSYGMATAKAIIDRFCHDYVVVKENGVWPIEADLEELQWKPACELDGPDAPDPFDAPSLPIPFNVNELAAFMLDGIGALASSSYGSWSNGPDEEVLQSLGILAKKAREALRDAYAAYRDAERVIGKLDLTIQNRTHRLTSEYDQANSDANKTENIWEPGISAKEYSARRALAKASITVLSDALEASRQESSEALLVWRKAMVNQLLRADVNYVSGSQVTQKKLLMMDGFEQRPVIECKNADKYQSLAELIEPFADGPFEKLPEAMREIVTKEFFPMPHWDRLAPDQRRSMAQQHDVKHDPAMTKEHDYWFALTCKIYETESEITRWELLNDRGIPSEALTKKNELHFLHERLNGLNALFKLPAFTVENWGKLTDEDLEGLITGKPSSSVTDSVNLHILGLGDTSDAETTKVGLGWSLKTTLKSFPGYRLPLSQFLKISHKTNQPCPKAADVLFAWTQNPPPGVKVVKRCIEYEIETGQKKLADLKSIQAAIKNMTEKSK